MQIAPGLYSIRQDEGGHVHAFLVDDGAGLTLIDTLYNDDASVVTSELNQIGRPVTDIKNIILTHAHRSHLGGLAALKKLSNATVYSHQWEEEIIAGKRKATPVSLWPRAPLQVYSLQVGLALGLKPMSRVRLIERSRMATTWVRLKLLPYRATLPDASRFIGPSGAP